MSLLLLAFMVASSPDNSAALNSAVTFPPETDPIAGCENRWFLKKEAKDPETRVLGFAYIDPEAGFTFEFEDEIVAGKDGSWVRKPNPMHGKASMKVRVGSNISVACLDKQEVAKLGLATIPDWLRFYKDARAIGPHEVSWASHLNGIGANAEAIKHIQAAIADGYKSDRMWFELGYAYDALGEFDKSMEVLAPAMAASPENKLLIGELAYSSMHRKDFKRAIELYHLALSKYKDGETEKRADYALNLAAAYHLAGDEKAAQEWLQKGEAWQQLDQAAKR